ncbi:hypothetical protein RJZ56_003118 [Blastomyces dermatitidis]|uniref:Integral membrane protein n=3 Tax=Blastomyces TaxID=229219 RepID=A0A179UQX7_BLAGS|nr:uncharacterized protein BDBG_05050 [Blastomyces gilchristii SLH14081]XP_045271913.1 uncharacterized protein BDCG_00605 [Blastomyces dermatitidis ER-3]EEQ83800.1 integral membrane protein [Blastomyces dermatitidis ER-3]EGE80139.1 integral membrane protein [Blastomyces dermatitidis ATCC 18188]OAT08822.1 integral membrane protein [Blastomyces gilchristii SLH14081]
MANNTVENVMDLPPLPLGTRIAIASVLAVSLYNALELFVLIFVAFRTFKGLYFWSLLLSTSAGIVPYSIGFLLGYFAPPIDSEWPLVTLVSVGWWVTTTGQSLILYSRLYLVLRNTKVLRLVLFMIVANAVIFHLPGAIVSIRLMVRESFLEAYIAIEKVQMTVFCVQELIISTLYIWETVKMLRLSLDRGNRRIMWQLISINVIVTVMDVGLLAAVYANLYLYEPSIRVMIYSIKLKLEFAVLGQLVHLASSRSCCLDFTIGSNGFPDFVDPTRITTDITHARRLNPVASKPLRSESDDAIDTPSILLPPPGGSLSGDDGHYMTRSTCSRSTQTNPISPSTTLLLGNSSRSGSREQNGEASNPETECPG